MVESDTDLEDALVEITDRVRLVNPGSLERLVLFEELTAIELGDPLQQRRCRRVSAALRRLAASDLGDAGAGAWPVMRADAGLVAHTRRRSATAKPAAMPRIKPSRPQAPHQPVSPEKKSQTSPK